MRRPRKFIQFWSLALTGTAVVVFFAVAAGNAPRRVVPATLGAYKVEVRGALNGSGTAAVGAQSVNVNATLQDAMGNRAHLTAPAIPIVNGRFDGNGTVANLSVRVYGRIDPPSDSTTGPRLSLQIDDPQRGASRAIAFRSGD